MEPEGWEVPVSVGEEVAFQWIHEGPKMIVTRCVRLNHQELPGEWAARQEWPPKAVDDWVPEKQIGRGGNGEVWVARGKDGTKVAIKFLHRMTAEGYQRFRSEVVLMQSLEGVQGVLPLLAYHLPDKLSKQTPAWLATPLVTPFKDYRGLRSLEDVVGFFCQISETLSRLAARGISHRDLKPDNLFVSEGRAVIGDLGLASYPGKVDVTPSNQKLGPMFYLEKTKGEKTKGTLEKTKGTLLILFAANSRRNQQCPFFRAPFPPPDALRGYPTKSRVWRVACTCPNE